MSDEIPFHVQEEIIKRLPVISLLQFRSVSKAWKSLIESSDFIAAHSVTQPQHLLFKPKDPVKFVCFVDDDTFPHQQGFVHTRPLSILSLKHTILVGISHGLLCFHGYYGEVMETETVVLCNPSIRKSITVHLPNKSNPDHETDLIFGVCPVSGDPKIIQMIQFSKTSYHCEAKVYNVSSGKWTSLSTNLTRKPFCQVVVNGFIYWCAFDPNTNDNDNMIMSFDITNENFGWVNLPYRLRRHPPTWLELSKLRESIVMLEYDRMMKNACGVWMMDIGVEKSFTKLFTVEAPNLSREIKILGFRKSGQPIVKVDYDHGFIDQSEFVFYKPNSERFNDLEVYRTTKVRSVDSYMETLVLLGRSDCNSY